MVYMAAQLSADLDATAVRDLREMERANLDPAVRVVVQINRNWPSQPQIYEIEAEKARVTNANVVDEDMGKPTTLANFLLTVIEEDKKTDGNNSDRGYILVLWGHSYGLGFGRDHGDGLTIKELKDALETFRTKRPGRRPLDILGANACAMAYVEAAYELRNHADYIVASQIAVPFAGWPFETVLGGIKPGTSAREVGKLIVDRYVATFRAAGREEFVAMSLLNLYALRTSVSSDGKSDRNPFLSIFADLVSAILKVVEATDSRASDRLMQVRAAFLSAGVGEVRPLIDLLDLCTKLRELSADLRSLYVLAPGIDEMETAAQGIVAFLKPGPEEMLQRVQASTDFLVVAKQTGEERGLNGLGVFAPFVTDAADLKRLEIGDDKTDLTPPAVRKRQAALAVPLVNNERQSGRDAYQELDLVSGTRWAELVYDVLRAGLPADVIDTVEASGTTSRADRAAVTQMLVAVDSLFDVLDRRVAAVRQSAESTVPVSSGAGGFAPPKRPDPFLKLQLLRHKDVREATQKPTSVGVSKSPPGKVEGAALTAIDRFEALETTLGDVERAVRRTLTNGTFGLGPGPGGSISLQSTSHGKGGGGHGAPRDDKGGGGHGAPDLTDKGGGGHGAVPAGVVAGVALSALASTPTAVIADLFAEVGSALQAIETAVGEAETLLAFSVTSGVDVVNGGPPNAKQVERAFRMVDDASTDARRTLRRVLAHPLYGFGPGPDDVTVQDRRELARVGGLSSTQLKLM